MHRENRFTQEEAKGVVTSSPLVSPSSDGARTRRRPHWLHRYLLEPREIAMQLNGCGPIRGGRVFFFFETAEVDVFPSNTNLGVPSLFSLEKHALMPAPI